jgi:hypothetical protein
MGHGLTMMMSECGPWQGIVVEFIDDGDDEHVDALRTTQESNITR